MLRLLPALVAAPLAARASHRWGRRSVMLAMDASRAAFVVLLPLLSELWWVYLWALLVEVAGLVFLPARDAAIPDLAGDEDLDVANGLMLGSSYGSIPLGAGLFAAVSGLAVLAGAGEHLRFVVVFAVDAATFVVSFAAIRAIPRHSLDAARTGPATPAERSPRFADALRIPLVAAVVPAAATVALGVGALASVGVSFVEGVLDASSAEFGALVALFGVGAVGGLVASRLFPAVTLERVRTGVLVIGLAVALMSLSVSLPLAFAGAVVFGAAAAGTLVVGMTLLQNELQGAQRDLAFTAFHVVIRGGLAVAAIVAGGVADLLGSALDAPAIGLADVAPARLVLFGAGLLTLLGAAAVRERREHPLRVGSP